MNSNLSPQTWKTFFVGLCHFLLCWLAFSQAKATLIVKVGIPYLAHNAEYFIQGKVESKASKWLGKANKSLMYTLVKVRVLKEISGKKVPKTITIRTFGGKIGETEIRLPNFPYYMVGREILVALKHPKSLPANQFVVVGLDQGKWIIARPKGEIASLAPIAFQKQPTAVYHLNTSPSLHQEKKHQVRFSHQTLQALIHNIKTEIVKAVVQKKKNILPFRQATKTVVLPASLKPRLLPNANKNSGKSTITSKPNK